MVLSRSTYAQDEGEPGGGKRITEQAGYVPPKVQIESMILAGVRLDDARREAYDFAPDAKDEDIQDLPVHPLRSKSIDLADVSQLQMALRRRYKAAQKAKLEAAQEVAKAALEDKPAVKPTEKNE